MFDPMYFLFILPGLALSLWASFKTRSAFNKYSKVRAASGLTGAQAALRMLQSAGITDVEIVRHHGTLSDHYNPVTKKLALSEPVYDQPSLAAIGVACHEAGHAIQHAEKYAPLWLRSVLVPTANIGSSLGYIVMIAGLFMGMMQVFVIGAVMFSMVLAVPGGDPAGRVRRLGAGEEARVRQRNGARQRAGGHGQGAQRRRAHLRRRRGVDLDDPALLPDASRPARRASRELRRGGSAFPLRLSSRRGRRST